MSVRQREDEVYRVTRQHDGHWVWCDRYGNRGGDNIDLVREVEPGIGFVDAVKRLLGAVSGVIDVVRTKLVKRQPPKLPPQRSEDREAGRAYLMSRGISLETIHRAEAGGMVRYTNGAVLFVGYDQAGVVQNATRRAIDPSAEVQKRDLRGSDKSYPPILPGNPSSVWIVEGGADALAARDVARRRGVEPPTVIVSSGANVRSFLENERVQAILRRADRVVVAGENEKDSETQEKTDSQHEKQADRIREITNAQVQVWKPSKGKDLADLNAIEVAEQRKAERKLERENSRSRGMDLGL